MVTPESLAFFPQRWTSLRDLLRYVKCFKILRMSITVGMLIMHAAVRYGHEVLFVGQAKHKEPVYYEHNYCDAYIPYM